MLKVLELTQPRVAPVALVVDSPHSGRHYPDDHGYAVDFLRLRTAEDAFVDELCQDAPETGAVLLAALFPRAYVDPNRDEDDINPDFVHGDYPTALNPGPKSGLGIGLVRQKLASGESVYDRRLTTAEFQHRIEHYYRPYHHQLKALLEARHEQFGAVWHLDMHSMASTGNVVTPDGNVPRPYDIVLGDLDGTSCDGAFTAMVGDVFRAAGLRVRLNDPYKGAAINRRYGRPAQGRHTLQIEMNRALYLDEVRIERTADFAALRRVLRQVFEHAAIWAKDHTENVE